jgi:hypothetical protein
VDLLSNEAYVITKILHVFFAVAWIGGSLVMMLVIVPVVNRMDPPRRGEFMKAAFPAMMKYGNIVGGSTLLTGVGLVSMNPYGYTWGTLLDTQWGKLVALALVAALFMLYLINFAIKPTFIAMGKAMAAAAPGEPPAGMPLLQKRMVFTQRLVLIIGLVALTAMVVANSLFTLNG